MEIKFLEPKDLSTGLGIPYPKNDYQGSKNAGYFDTKLHPEKIALIPELQGCVELEDFIKSVNNLKIFRPLRCDIASSTIDFNGFKNKISSYVTIAFEILLWNEKENFKRLYGEFIEFAKMQNVAEHNIVEFELIPTSYIEHLLTSWSLDIWCTGFGTSEREARANWQNGIQIVKVFLVDQNYKYYKQYNKGMKTIGKTSL